MEKLLVIGDAQIAGELESGLGRDYEVLEGTEPTVALELFLKQAPKVVILDLYQGSEPQEAEGVEHAAFGLRFLEWLVRSRRSAKVVALVPQGERQVGYRAVQLGAYDFHQKPVDLPQLKMILTHAFQLSQIEEQTSRLQQALEQSNANIEGIAGECAAMREFFRGFQRAAFGFTRPRILRETPEPAEIPEAPEAGLPPNLEPQWCPSQLARTGGAGEWQVEQLAFPAERMTLREVRDRVEKGMITAAVDNCGGNIVKASMLLGVSRPALYDLMKKHGLHKPTTRQ